MDKQKVLDAIFNDDEFDILNVKPKVSSAKNEEERLLASFAEINEFVSKNNKEPQANPSNIAEFQLYSRLKKIREKELMQKTIDDEAFQQKMQEAQLVIEQLVWLTNLSENIVKTTKVFIETKNESR